jgi:hypothetical protein
MKVLLFFFLFVVLGLELRVHLEPLHQSFFMLGTFEIGFLGINWPGLASNLDSLDLCLLRSWDYRREPLASG